MSEQFLRDRESITISKEGVTEPCLRVTENMTEAAGRNRKVILHIPLTTLGDNLMVDFRRNSSRVIGCEVDADGNNASYTTHSGSIYHVEYSGLTLFEAQKRARRILDEESI